jgi:monoamine oxidase
MQIEGLVREEQCDVVVVGAGAAGLVAGTALLGSADVLVLEASGRPGGRVESVRRGDYWLNIGTQFTEGVGALFEVMDRYGIERGSLAGRRAGLYFNGKIVDVDSPPALLLRSRVSLRAKYELARMGLGVKLAYARMFSKNAKTSNRAHSAFENAPATVLMRGIRSPEITSLFECWAGSWIGCAVEETAATQLLFSIGTAMEKAAKVPNFALPVGGNQSFTDALAAELGDRLRLNAVVTNIRWTDDSVTVEYADADGPVRVTAKHAIVATPADRAFEVMPDLPPSHQSALGVIRYGRYVVGGIFTNETGEQRWDDYYSLSTPELSFQCLFNHAAPLRTGPRKDGGAFAVMSGGPLADRLAALSDAEIEAEFRRDLLAIYPELEGHIEHVVIKRQPRVVSYWAPGTRKESQQTLRRPLGPIMFAGDYLGDPSLAAAAASGERAARKILEGLPVSVA